MISAYPEDTVWKAYNDFHYFCDGARMQKIFARHRLFLDTKDLPGHIIDAGVFKGSSTILFAHMLRIYSPLTRKKVVEGAIPIKAQSPTFTKRNAGANCWRQLVS